MHNSLSKLSRAILFFALYSTLFALCSPLHAQTKRAMEIEDLFRAKRVSDPQISPDGKWIAYVVANVNKEANNSNSDIWLIPSNGGESRQLTFSPKGDNNPRWSPDGKMLSFVSTRSGMPQIYVLSLSGGEAKQLTTISTGASQQTFSPDGKWLAYISSVYPQFSELPFKESDKKNAERDEATEKSKVKAMVFDQLLYRHWDSWTEFKRMHIFVQPITGGEPKDLTPGNRDAVPNSSTFSAGDDYAWSPDGKEIAYTATPANVREEAWVTNHDVYTVNVTTGERKNLTEKNLAADGFPRYSPDGKYIAYRAQRTPMFEADKWELFLFDRKDNSSKSLTEKWDYVVGAFAWSGDSKKLFFPAEDKAEEPLWSVSIEGETPKQIVTKGVISAFSISGNGMLAYTRATMMKPADVYSSKSDGKNEVKITTMNDELFSGIEMNAPENIWWDGAKQKVQAWLVQPPKFDSNKKYPLVYLVHGGPQGAWMNGWSYRWNPQLWAAQGYVVVCPNPTGSTGFGQQFTNDISHDWGGKVYTDLINGVDYVTKKYSFIDGNNMAAAGASYGGYMMNWFQGHTKKFKTLVTHCGVYNFFSMYGTTEEVWFDEWEHGGTPWEKKDEYEKFSPHNFAGNFTTPNLIIHNALDFRVPVSEGMQLFTALQRQNVPSKFLYFPDEGHWVLKPLNSEYWHQQVFGWLKDYLK
ncbi:MAG: S9 family peptidase [Ignavibacteria bacterium]|nr:S9 family peptidase [Ignavibacteria bacterium]